MKLGIAIKGATPEKYEEIRKRAWNHVDELVEIRLFDMTPNPDRELSFTWGGANSIQGFGAQGGANRVEELGTPGSLHLIKPVCVDGGGAEPLVRSDQQQ